MDISIIVLNLNTRDLLANCLRSIAETEVAKEETAHSLEVIVSDNGSTDGSSEMVRQNFPEARVVENLANLGFAKGNNQALPYTTGRYVLFLNSDTILKKDTLTEMVRMMDGDPVIGAASCYLELWQGGLDWNCHRGFPTPGNAFLYFTGLYRLFPRSKIFGGYFQSYKDLKTIHEVDAIEGAFFFVRRGAAEAVALRENVWWDEDYFFFAEDLDFCYRLRKAGWKVVFNPRVRIHHYKGATHGFNRQGKVSFSKEEKFRLVRSTTEGMRVFYEKHYLKRYPRFLSRIVFIAIYILERMRMAKGGI